MSEKEKSPLHTKATQKMMSANIKIKNGCFREHSISARRLNVALKKKADE